MLQVFEFLSQLKADKIGQRVFYYHMLSSLNNFSLIDIKTRHTCAQYIGVCPPFKDKLVYLSVICAAGFLRFISNIFLFVFLAFYILLNS